MRWLSVNVMFRSLFFHAPLMIIAGLTRRVFVLERCSAWTPPRCLNYPPVFIMFLCTGISGWCRSVTVFYLYLCRIWVQGCRRVRCVTTNRGWKWSSATSRVTETILSSGAGRFMKTTLSSPATWKSCWRYWYDDMLLLVEGAVDLCPGNKLIHINLCCQISV